MTRRTGMTLVEIVVALAILSLGLVVIFEGLSSGRQEVGRLDVLISARWLGQSLLERTVDQVTNRDNRYFELDSPPADILLGAVSGRWKRSFEALARPRTRLLEPDGSPGPYFQVGSGPAWPDPLDATEVTFWKGFSYEVRVGFETRQESGGAALPIDANGDGRAETDLASLEVEVYWGPADGSAPERTVCRMTTLIGSPDKPPGIGALVDE